jgi:hypothetical protein
MRALRTGEGYRCENRANREILPSLHLHPLGTQQLFARPSMVPPTPITPEQGCGTDHQGMPQDTHLARLFGGAALRTLHWSRREQGRQLLMLAAYTTRRLPSASLRRSCATSDWLAGQRSVPSGWRAKSCEDEAALFPGQGDDGFPIPLWGRRRVRSLMMDRGEGRSKLGRAHRRRLKLMTQFQAQIPDPLRDDLPAFLARCGMAGPSVRVLLQVFIGQSIFKGAAMQIQRDDVARHERVLRQIGQEQFIDDACAGHTDPTLDCPSGMSCYKNPTQHALRTQSQTRTVIEATRHPAFRVSHVLIGRKFQTGLDLRSLQNLIVFAAHNIGQS